jgi:hypothetical protein
MPLSASEWEFKLTGAVDLPFNFQFSGQYIYYSGAYWTPYVRVRGLDYNAYTGRELNLVPLGSEQFDARNLIDLRLAWTAAFSKDVRLTLQAECFNCLNTDTMLDNYNRWGDYRLGNSNPWRPAGNFGDAYQIERPRELRAGIRLEF